MRKTSCTSGAALIALLEDRIEQSQHRLGDLVLQLVDDRVQPDLDAFLLGQFCSLALRPDVEADHDGVRRRSQQDVALRDGADTAVEDLDPHLLGRHLAERVGEHLYGALHVALENERQVFDTGLLDLFRKPLEGDTRALRKLRLALLHLAVLRNALGLVAVRDHEEVIAGIRHAFETQDLDRSRWPGFFDGAPAIVKHRADLAEGVADDKAFAVAQRAILHQHARHRTAAAIELGFEHGADAGTIGSRLQVAKIGGEADHFEQQVEVHPLLRRDIDEDGRAAPGLGHQPAIAQLLLDAIRLRLRLVDLVDRHDDRHIGRLRVVHCFERLRHHAVIRRDHDDDDIRHLRAACTHAGESLVTRGIEEDDLAAECRRVLLGDADLVGTDVLRDATGLARGHVCFADCIQQRGLAMIDVTHDSDDRWAHDFDFADVFLSEQRFERFVRHLVFEADDAGVGAELTRHILHQFSIERLVHGDKDTAHQERRDEILATDSELFCEVLYADTLGHRDGAGDGQRLLRNLRSTKTRWWRKALHRAFFGLRVLLASTAAWRTARTLRARRLARRRHEASTGGTTHARTLTEARTATWSTRTRAKAGTATRCAAWRRARGMHRPATCRKTWSAGRSARTLRIAARATRTLEDGTSTLDDTTGAGRRSGPLAAQRGAVEARCRRAVDRSAA